MEASSIENFIRQSPKVELHLHIEGTLEPELMFALAKHHRLPLKYPTINAIRKAYEFNNLQSFLDIYYEGAQVLCTEEDFYELTWQYLKRMAQENVRHVEIFFDPQTHTQRNIPFGTIIEGIHRALKQAHKELKISSFLIMCFLRHLSADQAMQTLEEALPYLDKIKAVGLDSSEVGHPPQKFKAVFDRARKEGLIGVAHAGEEGPPEYIWQAIELLKVTRIDHGVRCIEDPKLMEFLKEQQIPLTVCPLSNIKLRVFDKLHQHNLKKLLEDQLCVTINSDDPAYFGGYITQNFLETQKALQLNLKEVYQLMDNAIQASFLPDAQKLPLRNELETLYRQFSAEG